MLAVVIMEESSMNPPADSPESDSSKGVLQAKKEKEQQIEEETVCGRLRTKTLFWF